MFIKSKTRARMLTECLAYASRMLLSFKTWVTYKLFLTSSRTTMSVMRQLSSVVTRFFAGYCPMSDVNI